MSLARRGATLMLRSPIVGGAVRALARARGRGLVLVYHRLGCPVARDCEVIPSVPVHLFRAQIQALGEVVDLVPLEDLLGPREESWTALSGRPRVAVTFDDDLPSHVALALPPLRAMRVPATFFLSGRALHGRGAYWFQRLELLLMTRGPREIAARVGVPDSGGAALVLACERDLTIRRKIVDLAAGGAEPSVLGRAQIAELAAAGVTIGFHTVEHPVLPDLPDDALPAAVCEGRDELAAAAGGRLRFFAYPHGKTNARAAQAVRRAGFEAAFTGRPESVRAGQDPYTIGRWEPGPIPVEQLLVKLAIYLHRPVQRQP